MKRGDCLTMLTFKEDVIRMTLKRNDVSLHFETRLGAFFYERSNSAKSISYLHFLSSSRFLLDLGLLITKLYLTSS